MTESLLKEIQSLSLEDKFKLMLEFSDDLGLCSIEEYCQIMRTKKRTIQSKLKNEQMKYLPISNKKFPLINY